MSSQDVGPPPGAEGPVGIATSAHGGWGQMRRAVNRSLPTALVRSYGYRLAARRNLRRRGR